MTYLKDRTVDRKCDQQINILYGLNSKQEVRLIDQINRHTDR